LTPPKQPEPAFSIITVCLNSEKTVERTINSVLNQTFNDVEYIIIDGGSTDNTLNIIESYEEQITTIISEPDKGLYYAMNKGLALAKGRLIGIINSDDWYEPNTLDLVYQEYLKTGEEAVFHGLCKYYENGKEGKILSYHHDILKYTNIAHPTCFISKEIYDEFGFFDTDYKIAADYELLLRLYSAGVLFKRIERVLANFDEGGISESDDSHFEVLRIRRQYDQINKLKYRLKMLKLKFSSLIKI